MLDQANRPTPNTMHVLQHGGGRIAEVREAAVTAADDDNARAFALAEGFAISSPPPRDVAHPLDIDWWRAHSRGDRTGGDAPSTTHRVMWAILTL